MDEYKLKDYTERLKKETNENAHKMLYMWIKQDIISLSEYQKLVLNLSLQLVSKLLPDDKEIIAKARDNFDPWDSNRDMQDGIEHGFMDGASWVVQKINNVC